MAEGGEVELVLTAQAEAEAENMPAAGLDTLPGRCTLSVERVGGAAPDVDLNWRPLD